MTTTENNYVYLNGSILPLAEAHISPLDRGFLFGDAIYDTFPIYDGVVFRFEAHWQRLLASLNKTQIVNPFTLDSCMDMLLKLYAKNRGTNQIIYLQISRGVYSKRSFSTTDAVPPTVFAMSTSLVHTELETLAKGIKVITLDDTRRQNCDIKTTSLLPSVMLFQEAAKAHDEAILIRGGHALEGIASNLFIMKDNALITPPMSKHILGGTTRDAILSIARDQTQLTVREAPITLDELYCADEVWLTGTRREISPVITIDNKRIGTGKVGENWYTMIKYYREYREKQIHAN